MRLKQLLGTILLATAATAAAAASVSQLSGVLVKDQNNAGVVTILASGAFTHTEYRPTDNLMLVDLAGVSIAQPDPVVHAVMAPGVRSYRVVGYRSASGAETTRVELTLAPGAKVGVSDVAGGVELRITGAAAAAPSKEIIAKTADVLSQSSAHTQIRDISISHNQQGLDVQITGSGPLTAKTMKLTGPDRLVLDIPNAVLDGRPREIAVNSNGVKAVRAARYQDNPPVTRVVVDLVSARSFDVSPSGNKLVVKMNDVPSAVPAIAPASAPVVASAAAVEKTSASGPAPILFSAIPLPEEKEPAKTAEKIVTPEPSRADKAASHFAHETAPVPSINEPPYASSASLATPPAVVNAALQQQAMTPAPVAAPVSNCTSGRYTGEPIGLNFKDLDLKDFFKVIQEISGLNVVLDPAVHGTVSIYLNDVPWDQALAIVLNNNGLECQLQGNVLRIATLETLKNEAEARRAQQEAQALAVPKQTITRYLSYGQSKDAVAIIKKFLSPRGDVVADPRSNALIIEDIPGTLPKVEELIRTLDRKTPEVEVEARVVASTRTFARDIGTQLAFGFATGNTTFFGNPGNGNSPIITSQQLPSTTLGTPNASIGPSTGQLVGTAGQIPLFSNLPATAPTSGLGFSSFNAKFRLDFILSMAESRGLLKILSRPHVVTQNNIPAVIRQGTRVPIVTQAQLGGPPTVQYIDAFLRLTVTPQITAENTIFLNLDVENTVPDFSRVSGSQLNPSLNTQQATTSVLVTDGGTVVIGGVIQTQNSLAIAQVPLLGSIPVLGNLFKHTNVNTSTQELIFFITPKIIQT